MPKTAEIVAMKDRPLIGDDTLTRIERYIESPPENSRVFTITPEIAEFLLTTYNVSNRPKKPGNIARYTGHMAARTWMLTGDTLKFSDAKKLRDGQNRLAACVRAGVPFKSHFVFGIDDSAFDVMDRGKPRTGADVLSIIGQTHTTHLAGAIRWTYLIDEGRAKQRDFLQPDVMRNLLVERYSDLPGWIRTAAAVKDTTGQPIGLVAACLYLFSRVNEAEAERFAAAWQSASGGKFSAILKMQKAIAQIASTSSGRVHDVVRAALIVKAWNVYMQGRRGQKSDFDWRPADDFPVIGG